MIQQAICTTILASLLGFTQPAAAQGKADKRDLKFLDDISVSIEPQQTEAAPAPASRPSKLELLFSSKKNSRLNASTPISSTTAANLPALNIEQAEALQFKYALLLDTEVELIQNISLLRVIDGWMGTPYVYGGTTKRGIDCSALMQTLFATAYGLTLPRTAREQYKFSEQISRTDLREGDLVFFNTTGGVSHVGIYLQNNKFVHASSSQGVTVSDLYEDYWMKRLIGVGRVNPQSQPTPLFSQP